MRHDGGDTLALCLGVRYEAVMDVEHVHAEYLGRRVEREVVERGRDRPFQRVFGRHDAIGALAAVNVLEHLSERHAWHQLRVRYAELAHEHERRLVAVRSRRAQISYRNTLFRHGKSSRFPIAPF